jgi:hypothetical protein
MAHSKPSMQPKNAPRSGRVEAGADRPGIPSAVPPGAAGRTKSGCDCEDTSTTSQGAVSAGAKALGSAAPALRPPGLAAGGVAATWQSNVHVTGLWSINQDRNCWVYLDTVGWRNLSGDSESGLVSMNMLAAHAYQQGSSSSFYEEDDGRISQIYVW